MPLALDLGAYPGNLPAEVSRPRVLIVSSSPYPPPDVFLSAAILAETEDINRNIVETLDALPDPWSYPVEVIRQRRREGKGPFPLAPKSERAHTESIDGPAGRLELRILAPDQPRGVYLHLHGGGWTLGASDQQDPLFERYADNCGLASVSVEYRLAPEHPYPAAPDDCEAAALWLVDNAQARFGTSRLIIGGESAGAHLAVLTLLRLRDRHGLAPFAGANLIAGCFDLGMTPSVRNWGDEKLILNTRDIGIFTGNFLPGGMDPRSPEISPLYADLAGMPAARFTCGTRDPLVDDSMFMAARWAAAGARSELALYPGGAHIFMAFPGALASQGHADVQTFLNSL